MAAGFGKTWWGQQWLRALANIDYSNRLPVGSSYARKGAVVKLGIEGNTIKAKVKGSRSAPYDVTILMHSFSRNEIDELISELAEQPVILSKLLNRELDPQILQIAENKGLKVFPHQWSDFEMYCNCRDWAFPCKHLAAVIYKISAEIDNNPFLIFQLHNVDLVKELGERRIYISAGQKAPSLYDILRSATKKTETSAPALLCPEQEYKSIDYSILYPISEALIQLLAEEPVFYPYPGDFKDKYAAQLRKAIRNIQKVLGHKVSQDEFFTPPIFSINHHTDILLSITNKREVRVCIDNVITTHSVEQMISVLWQIPVGHLSDYQPSIVALRNIVLFCFNLIANGAVIPQIVTLENKSYKIRWIPAMLSKEVRTLIDKLEPLLPDNLLWFDDKNLVSDKLVNISSVMIDAIIEETSNYVDDDIYLNLFFNEFAYQFKSAGQEALPGGINTWLQPYFFTYFQAQGKYKPTVVVSELEHDEFQITINVDTDDKTISLRDILRMKKHEKIRFEVLQSLAILSSFITGLDEHIYRKAMSPIVMDNARFARFLMQIIPAIRLLDIDILLPKALQTLLKPRTSVKIKQKHKDILGLGLRIDKMLDFDWQIAVGDYLMSEKQFKELLKNSNGLIKYKSQYICVSSSDLEKLYKHLSLVKSLSSLDMLRAALGADYYGAKVSLSDEVKELIKQLTEQPEIKLPKGLKAELRPYQQYGFEWMYRNSQIGFGSVIADDMGLGKTLQLIALLLKHKENKVFETKKALIVAPVGLLANRVSEMEKFAPALKVKLYYGINRDITPDDVFDVVLTSYEIMSSDLHYLRKRRWCAVIFDEAQNIQNYETAQTKAIKSIPADTFIAMSSTPMENRLSELWSMMDFCNKGFLGTMSEFKETFIDPIQIMNDVTVIDKLKAVTAPFLLRRRKNDKTIISELPEKIEIDSYAYLSAPQAALYEKIFREAMKEIERIEKTDPKSLFTRQELVSQMMLTLQQICNHPAQFVKNSVLEASLSGKTDLLLTKLDNIIDANEKALILTQFPEMGSLLRHFITEHFGEKPLFYHGGCTLKARKEMIETFQTNRADKIFILSQKAGTDMNLNLTAVNHVIHYDLCWNPAEDQACYINPKSEVIVHRLITKATFEERLNEIIHSEKDLSELNNKELRAFFHHIGT